MFLSDRNADYVGMAKRYQKELIDRGILKKLIKEDSSDIPVRLEFCIRKQKAIFMEVNNIYDNCISNE